MAKDLALDPKTRDIMWPPHYITGRAEIEQCLINLLLTPKGTFLNYPDVGMDYTFVYKHFNPFELRLSVHNALLEDRRVTHINNIQIKKDKQNIIHINVDVQTTKGRIQFDKEMSRRNATR